MEKCLRIALWMVVLTGCLQAKPVTPGTNAIETCRSFEFDPLEGFESLRDVNDVDCRQSNATFPSLRGMNKPADCVQARVCCIEGLKDAMLHCIDENKRIQDTLEALEEGFNNMSLPRCKRPKTSTFEDFVNRTEKFVQSVYSAPTSRK